jgi:hypothetical protein
MKRFEWYTLLFFRHNRLTHLNNISRKKAGIAVAQKYLEKVSWGVVALYGQRG